MNAPATAGRAAEEQARAVLQQYEAAFNANDAAAMNALFSVDATFVNFGGRLVVGRDNLLDAQQFVFDQGGPLEHVSVRYEVLQVLPLSETIVAVHASQRSPDADDSVEAVFTVVVQRTGEGWRIRLGQNTPVA